MFFDEANNLTNEDLHDLAVQMQVEREENFKHVDSKTCTHDLVYCKQGDDYHCQYCDKFMYDASKD